MWLHKMNRKGLWIAREFQRITDFSDCEAIVTPGKLSNIMEKKDNRGVGGKVEKCQKQQWKWKAIKSTKLRYLSVCGADIVNEQNTLRFSFMFESVSCFPTNLVSRRAEAGSRRDLTTCEQHFRVTSLAAHKFTFKNNNLIYIVTQQNMTAFRDVFLHN